MLGGFSSFILIRIKLKMSCKQCTRSSRHCSSYNPSLNYDPRYYSDVAMEPDAVEEEPVAPTLSLGNRILWLTEAFAASGIVRWIGRIPSVSPNWTAGIEFDNVMPDGGNGDFQGRNFFNSRAGHSLFLPVAELIKVDDNPAAANNERTSFFGRLQDSCSNFAHRRRRDSTFGHFKQECYSTCAQNEFHCNGHIYGHAPVYDRITSRRSLRYDDHPYERYNVCVPCGTMQPVREMQSAKADVSHVRNEPIVLEPDDRIQFVRGNDRSQHAEYDKNEMDKIHMGRKDSIFNPSFKLITGFKDWVSCLIQGTTRHRSKGKLVLKDRKSITSVFLSNNPQSLTGQRLSSFSEYASVSIARAPNNEEDAAVYRTRVEESAGMAKARAEEADDRVHRVKTGSADGAYQTQTRVEALNDRVAQNWRRVYGTMTRGQLESGSSLKAASQTRGELFEESGQVFHSEKGSEERMTTSLKSGNSLQTSSRSRKKSSKKRPAPQPPAPSSGMGQENKQGKDRDINRRSDHEYQRGGRYVTKTVKSTSVISHSVPIKKKYKKRRAPPPPKQTNNPFDADDASTIYAAVNKKERRKAHNRKGNCNYDNLYFPSVGQRNTGSFMRGMDDQEPGYFSNHKHKPVHRQLQRMPNISSFVNYGPAFNRSDLEDSSSSGSISFSPDDSEDEKYGLVKYAMGKKGESPATTSTNYLQYGGENNDVCLKISIQKTETNVVTVQEVSPPRTVRYTIEEDTSSSSELSDEPPIVPVKLKAITAAPVTKQELPDDSPTSTEENKEESKTIFDDLKLKPPVKGSVKDFVQAFNMLATKGSDAGENGSPAKNIQSFPTKWEFQNNHAYQNNQFLLPIAEESVNETSEQDGNVSVEESTSSSEQKRDKHNTKRRSQNKDKTGHTSQETVVIPPQKHLPDSASSNHTKSDITDDKCSHCYEKHSTKSNPKCQRKRSSAPRIENALKVKSTDQAHVAALSSLLHDKTGNEIPNGASKPDSKLDQPIMVGLYIEDKSSHKGPMPLLITPSMSLKKLKKQVEREYDLPRHQQCWILGQSFAVRDEASLASYGIREAGCPILLYVMSKEQRASSLPCRGGPSRSSKSPNSDPYTDERGTRKGYKAKSSSLVKKYGKEEKVASHHSGAASTSKESSKAKSKSDHHRAFLEEHEKKADYRDLVALDDVDLVPNVEVFDCPVCFMPVEERDGAVLQDCLHSFCRECLASAIQYSDTAIIRCPFANEEYSCESHLQEREIKCLVTPEVYERHLARSMALAESQAQDSFHCKTPDCPGWCLYEDNANTFHCPVCKRTNCLTCAAVHEGKNCRQYQDSLAFESDTSDEARKTREYLKEMVANGEAMECPKCQVILMKKWGCDWLKCSMCHSEVCWVTKGPRWGPNGRGDTSGGCKCMVNGVRCHPKCSYCH
ncbi:hypothetical protein JTE90_017603 [Oedothorax gibbosus]|uniref:RanBP-type and C3HC4-type zinc finger-containing protein 1 n=1 Tax=Oedothorax gibbosus TaxID=931172 RepID=A0AAV6U577_9ARAC|nr:hypothetical protein JTE90_017603 [Oedothorax gibbosus]